MGQTIKAFDEEGNEKEIDIDSIKWFGTEVEKTYYKNGKFKSFKTHTWIKIGSLKLYPEEWKISHFKKYFDKYDSNRRDIKDSKDGKEKKATEWTCEVLEEGAITLNNEEQNMVREAIKRKTFIQIKNRMFYYIFEDFFRDNTETNNYFHFDGEKLIDTKYSVRDDIREETLVAWRRDNIEQE